MSHNTTLSTIPYVPPVGQGDFCGNQAYEGHRYGSQIPVSQAHGNYAQAPVRQPITDQNQYAYIPSPVICRNPKDFDNVSDVSSILLKGSPKQLMFSNQSTPVRKEPKVYKPVVRSPMKPTPVHRQTGRVTIPEEVLYMYMFLDIFRG